MTRTAVYPGTFDPVTRGHEDIVRRSLGFADRVIVAVAINPSKAPLFDAERRARFLETVFADEPRISVARFEGLLAEFAKEQEAGIVVRGLRAVSDFEYEFQMALMNRELNDELETVFLVPSQDLTFLSSSLVKEVARFGGNVTRFVHPDVARALRDAFK